MIKAYTEIAFWLTTIAGAGGLAVQAITGYPGQLVSPDALFVAGIVVAIINFFAAALLKRATS